jgi:hypothetical protein
MIILYYIKSISHLIPSSSVGLQERAQDGFIPGFFNPLGFTNLIALLIFSLFLQEVHLVLLLVLVSVVPESARRSMILVR